MADSVLLKIGVDRGELSDPAEGLQLKRNAVNAIKTRANRIRSGAEDNDLSVTGSCLITISQNVNVSWNLLF